MRYPGGVPGGPKFEGSRGVPGGPNWDPPRSQLGPGGVSGVPRGPKGSQTKGRGVPRGGSRGPRGSQGVPRGSMAGPGCAPPMKLRSYGARAASSSSCSPSATSASQPMPPETQRVVQHQIDGLWATGSIIGQRLVAKGWSAGLVTSLTWTGEEPISRSRHRQQTARRPWSFGRYESCAPRDTLHSMCVAASEPLSSRARPPEVWRARRLPRQG